MIIERGTMEILWTCGRCQKSNEMQAPIWQDMYGDYVAIECPDCLAVEYVSTDNLEGDE